jgi:hypothetical protein
MEKLVKMMIMMKQMKMITLVIMRLTSVQCAWVLGELKSVLGYQGALDSLRLLGTRISLILP